MMLRKPVCLAKVEIITASAKPNTKRQINAFDDSVEEEDFDPRPLTAQSMIDKFKRGK